jgi:hypothetical protein
LSLQSICFPSSIRTVSRSCFKGCANLARIVLESGSQLSAESVSYLRAMCEVTSN